MDATAPEWPNCGTNRAFWLVWATGATGAEPSTTETHSQIDPGRNPIAHHFSEKKFARYYTLHIPRKAGLRGIHGSSPLTRARNLRKTAANLPKTRHLRQNEQAAPLVADRKSVV